MYDYNAKIINVVDGDTVDAQIDLGFRMTTVQRLRLNRVNTKEMHDKDPAKRKLAEDAKKYMTETLLNQNVVIVTHKSDAFGRWLAEVFLNNKNINDVLLESDLAIPYHR